MIAVPLFVIKIRVIEGIPDGRVSSHSPGSTGCDWLIPISGGNPRGGAFRS